MPKPFYADYVNHILRFYFRWEECKGFRNEVDEKNYKAAQVVIEALTPMEKELLSNIYTSDSINIADVVPRVSWIHNRDVSEIWSLISSTTIKIAKERRLL